MTNAIAAEGLHKSYGKTHALAGMDLLVPQGTVPGVLGPNVPARRPQFAS